MDISQQLKHFQIKKQRALVCFICGKEYGKKRIESHLVTC